MNPITNSPIKEGIRQKHHTAAAAKETQINNQLNVDCNTVQANAYNQIQSITYKKNPHISVCLILAIVLGIVFATIDGFTGFLIGAVIGVGVYVLIIVLIRKANSNLDARKLSIQNETDNKVRQLKDNAAAQIRAIYADADRNTQQEIDQYDAEVKRNCQIILKTPKTSEAIVDHTVNMFQRMISHADSASNKKFVEVDFIYRVLNYGISYKYPSTYRNPQDDFNFDKQRYRNLSTQEECEGLAQAIAKMTIGRIKSIYPPNSLNITVSHIDAEVTLHFKSANSNYVPPRNIF